MPGAAAVAVAGSRPAALERPAVATAPGDRVGAERYTVYADPGKVAAVPVDAWKVDYRSTSATGTAIDVSGSVRRGGSDGRRLDAVTVRRAPRAGQLPVAVTCW